MTDLEDEDRVLVIDFLERFARFESELKVDGCLTDPTPGAVAKANWNRYATLLGGRLLARQDTADAAASLLADPPKVQYVTEGQTARFEPQARNPRHSDERWLLRLVQTVRNNLFHGGKHAPPLGLVGEPARDRALLRACIVILDACLELNLVLRSRFRE